MLSGSARSETHHEERRDEAMGGSLVADDFTMLLTSAAALAGIVGVILLIGRALRHTTIGKPKSASRLLIVKDTIALDARRRLHLIQHEDRAVLLLTGGETDLVVGWLEGPKSP